MSTKFWGIEIWDATGRHYYTEVNVNEDIQHNRPTSSQTTYNSKYPFHIHNGKASYYSGSCTATFIDNTDNCEYDNEKAKEKAAEYTTNIVEWLHNDLTKYLKLSQDFILPVGILGEVKCSIESNNTIDDPFDTKVTFEWEQLADAIRGGEDG